jgi:hypothetical protein
VRTERYGLDSFLLVRGGCGALVPEYFAMRPCSPAAQPAPGAARAKFNVWKPSAPKLCQLAPSSVE